LGYEHVNGRYPECLLVFDAERLHGPAFDGRAYIGTIARPAEQLSSASTTAAHASSLDLAAKESVFLSNDRYVSM
jgi:hypothetical protein